MSVEKERDDCSNRHPYESLRGRLIALIGHIDEDEFPDSEIARILQSRLERAEAESAKKSGQIIRLTKEIDGLRRSTDFSNHSPRFHFSLPPMYFGLPYEIRTTDKAYLEVDIRNNEYYVTLADGASGARYPLKNDPRLRPCHDKK